MKDEKLKFKDLHVSHTLGIIPEYSVLISHETIKRELNIRLMYECRCDLLQNKNRRGLRVKNVTRITDDFQVVRKNLFF
jgi:hypothetical protein